MTYRLELEPNEVLLIGEALDAMPHGRVNKLHDKIQAQLAAQDQQVRHAYDEQIRAEERSKATQEK